MSRSADSPGSREIGFEMPERYNAGRILYDNLAAGRADKTAIRCAGRAISYRELCRLANRVGSGLAAMGLERSERVLLLLDDTPAYPAAVFGAIRAGFVPVLVNTLSPADDVTYFVRDSGARIVFAEAALTAKLADAGPGLERVVVVDGEPAGGLPAPCIR
ncbi:MAG TPA: AMP-binding protein, partial [Alphaproteobacteria bacterium]|nr:AMP-binding protein [Alphaproteobacteria bacterium]